MRLPRILPYAACLVALSGVVACGSPGSSNSGVVPVAGASAAGPQVVKRVEVSINGRTVTPAPAQLELAVGQTLELVVTSDHDDELHAHGFEVKAPLEAGVPTTVRLTAAEPGVYEVETHEPALTLLTVAVR